MEITEKCVYGAHDPIEGEGFAISYVYNGQMKLYLKWLSLKNRLK